MNFILALVAIAIGYFCGSINSSIIICKLMKLPSPRSVGSGNPGTTNVLRLGNKKAAAFTLIGDALKGLIPLIIAHFLCLAPFTLGLVALAAVLGHVFPIFFGFKGGKGVATGLGVLLGISPWLGLLVALTWLIIALIFRYSSLAAVVATILCPIYGAFIVSPSILIPLIILAIIVLIRHKANISRLLNGKETKIGQKAKK